MIREQEQDGEVVVAVAVDVDEPPPRLGLGTSELERIEADDAFDEPTRELPLHAVDGLRDDDIAQIVHDLKSPLAAITLEAELLEQSLGTLDAEMLGRAVRRILRNGRFLDRMVYDLLDLCALDAGRFTLQRAPTELRSLIEAVLDRVIGPGDRARVFFDPGQPLILDVDDLRLERVIANLLDNALKYAPSPSGVVVRIDRGPLNACVSVIDAGPGIAVGEQSMIFEKYRRAAHTGIRGGTGLGLYVSKRIIDAHGGRIGVETLHGAGSRFFFELPLT